MFRFAITREPGPDFAAGLTSAALGPPVYQIARRQHRGYVQALRDLGLEVAVLPALPGLPDACFVEDVAVITPELVVLTRPGAEARRAEVRHIKDALPANRPHVAIVGPATLDGGDVLVVEKRVFIGLSTRTNLAGAEQLGQCLTPYGYEWTAVPLSSGLHLKSDVNYLGRNTLLITAAWFDHPAFADFDKIVVAAEESYAANTLWVNRRLLHPEGFPATRASLLDAGFDLVELETSEMQKMDGGLSCLSLRF